ncbi:hypothetical protein BCPG3_192 [Bacillus phage BCPG3]|nr:hypothetical protein BCPG1_060 [Bacillus phage BCPG1]QSJ04509.1 hypothetical protein BCPG3_192 [Bacillus phage BCPG3]QSJ04718.1 hypothetical protein BCP18_186 [Bacillus phage BCP18]
MIRLVDREDNRITMAVSVEDYVDEKWLALNVTERNEHDGDEEACIYLTPEQAKVLLKEVQRFIVAYSKEEEVK